MLVLSTSVLQKDGESVVLIWNNTLIVANSIRSTLLYIRIFVSRVKSNEWKEKIACTSVTVQ